MYEWKEEICDISKINDLLQEYEVEVDSPDGYVPVSLFVDKGNWNEYILTLEDDRKVQVNENHLFETTKGWKFAKDLVDDNIDFITDKGVQKGKVIETGNMIPIVDIQIEHENHRYYANGVSSHNTNVGKTLAMCHLAASYMSQGYNVLYITLEISEEEIAKRIDANLLNINLDDILKLSKADFTKRFSKITNKAHGKLIIKEYPTASASALHFRALLNDLQLKKNFKPHVIIVDYINICMSSRMKQGTNVNSYTFIKAIAEELRGLGVEFEVPIWTATQTTRGGYSSSDPDLTDTSECIFVNEKVELLDGTKKCISDVVPGDQLISQDEFKTVMLVHHKKPKECVKITLKSGKTIIVSKNHVFPTNNGRKSIDTGLQIGDLLHSK